MTIFDAGKTLYKCNLHTHTTGSDGWLDPADALAFYEREGYDVLAITDHRQVTQVPPFYKNMLVLPGIELDSFSPECAHIVGIGVAPGLKQSDIAPRAAQAQIDAIVASGGLVIYAHPHWSLNTSGFIAALQDISAVEIYNAVSGPPYSPDRADSTYTLDLLARQGLLWPTVAADDMHRYEPGVPRGFIYLKADELSHAAVMKALRDGQYFASQGPRFDTVRLEGDELVVTMKDPVEHIFFHTAPPWAPNRCVNGPELTEARYLIDSGRDERFVRVIAQDKNGLRAWLNPFAV